MVLAVRGSNPLDYPLISVFLHKKININLTKNIYKNLATPVGGVITPKKSSFYRVDVVRSSCTTSAKDFFITSKDLVKGRFIGEHYWSPGIFTQLIFTYEETFKKKFLNLKNARKDWAVWGYGLQLLLQNASYRTISLVPWCLRTRRSMSMLTESTNIVFIKLKNNKFFTPKRRIKRWLKKKYTSQSWR